MLSLFATQVAAVRSPQTLTVVRDMSSDAIDAEHDRNALAGHAEHRQHADQKRDRAAGHAGRATAVITDITMTAAI